MYWLHFESTLNVSKGCFRLEVGDWVLVGWMAGVGARFGLLL